MNQATVARSAPRPASRQPVRTPAPVRLRVVGAPAHTRSRAGLVLACALLLGLGLVGLLLLNVSLEHGSYTLHAQQAKARSLQEREHALQESLAWLAAPQNLDARAREFGMVPNPRAAFIRTSDGRVLGVPTRAVAPPSPTVTSGAAVPAGTGTPTPSSPGGGTAPGTGVATPGPGPAPTR